jgi:hypothetical protein
MAGRPRWVPWPLGTGVVVGPHETASGRPSGSGPVIGVALKRTLALTGALQQRTPPQLVTLDPARAADHVLARLRDWGYL